MRGEAVHYIAGLDRNDERTLPNYMRWLADKSSDVRFWAAYGLTEEFNQWGNISAARDVIDSIVAFDNSLRVSTLPTQFGESVVLRVLDRSTVNLDLEALGMPPYIYNYICTTIEKPNGIFIVTGPTGSGKTTTLYAALNKINTIDSKVLTAEDPVEYNIEGIIQVPVNDNIGLTFARVLRAFLRQDPDRIMVGETRDIETAQIAIQASLTGHLVFTTLHTNDAPGAVTRLVDMGVEPFLISASLEGVLGQRLIRKICPFARPRTSRTRSSSASSASRRTRSATRTSTTEPAAKSATRTATAAARASTSC